MNKEKRPPFFPIGFEVIEGQDYYWCSCNKSKSGPFCDRKNCGDKAIGYHADLTETVYFCGCKQTKSPPFCDGSHAKLLFDFLKNKSS